MATVSGAAAIAWMRSHATNVPGACLNTIWQAYGSHGSIGPHAGQYPDAINGWDYATHKHPGDYSPPPGVPVYFDRLSRPRYAGDTNYRSGDVVLSLGGGQVICTDGPSAGRIGVMSIQTRAARIGRAYLGWTEDFLGYDVDLSGLAGTTSKPLAPAPAPLPQEGDTMRTVKSKQSGAVYNLGELTWQKLDNLEQGSMSAHIWNGLDGIGEPVVVEQKWIDTECGQIEKRRAQLAIAFKQIAP